MSYGYSFTVEDLETHVTHIDMARLEWEWARQSEMVAHWGRKVSKAQKDYTDAETELELVQAKVGLDIRLKPKRYNLPDKTTEAMIKAAVTIDDRTQEANKKVTQAKFKLDNLKVVLHGLEHKKKALENEVHLWTQGYFSKPKERDPLDREKLEEGVQNRRRLNNTVKRKRTVG